MTKDNTILKLKKEFDENKNSHVFLVETDNMEDSLKDIKDLIKHVVDTKDEVTSHQIDDENYIELSIIRPSGKDIKKDQIKELQERLKIKPILSKFMFYIIVDAELMNDVAANKLLKTIEEPNSNIVGFLISTNLDIMLPTIKSRCEILTMLYGKKEDSKIPKEIIDLTDKLIEAIENKDHITFYKLKSDSNILKDNYKTVEKLIKDYYNSACNFSVKSDLNKTTVEMLQKNSYRSLIRKAKYLNKIDNKLSKNMNGDLLLEKIFLDLKGGD